ncbi:YhgE/Pip domain-containing protein [Aurantimicrobium photophilum]|uniref:ABC-2 family transporter protein n=1 Tax=Aurantimicrobium photophilum TaxID=1987356 RepID=A0A2Z3S2R7_9MICO|nr:YhgE/Pip family protein [Aurantimicrobium photophilum]AWR21623.1 ABC-2 family transporter protein [Aurantimicrobium photophilum]
MASLITRLSKNSAKTEGKPRILTLAALIFVPLVVVGTLMWGLWNPTDRLDNVTAAIVNDDEPVTINGQLTPLGRLLTAGLVDGADGASNYNWEITDAAEAKKGLESGKYVAAVTIPKNFSKVATSSFSDASNPQQAIIDVTSSDKTRLVDDAITTAITSTAVNMLNQQLSASYIENVLIGFSTLSESLGKAASGAHDLSSGLGTLADGATQLSTGASQFSNGMWTLQSQASSIPGNAQSLADGLAGLSATCTQVVVAPAQAQFCGGLAQLSGGTAGLATGLGGLSDGITKLAAGSTDIATGVEGIASGTTAIASGSTELANGLDTAVENIPVYTEAETKKLSEVVTAPVGLKDAGNLSFGANSTPLYVVLSLWIGALAIFVGLRTLPQRLLESTRSSLSLATRSFVIPAVVGIAQGVAVATVIAVANGYDLGEWASVAGIAALIGIAFTATNQALNAVLGGFGRMVSLAVGILILVTGVISTVPALLDTLLGFTPANDAVTALQAVINSGNVSGFASAVTALVLWSLGGVLVTALAISRKRHVSITTLSKETQPV